MLLSILATVVFPVPGLPKNNMCKFILLNFNLPSVFSFKLIKEVKSYKDFLTFSKPTSSFNSLNTSSVDFVFSKAGISLLNDIILHRLFKYVG